MTEKAGAWGRDIQDWEERKLWASEAHVAVAKVDWDAINAILSKELLDDLATIAKQRELGTEDLTGC